MKARDTIAGLIIGAATGLALGLLFAPRKGSETRGAIAKSSSDYYDRISDDVKSTVENTMDKFMKKNSSRAEERARRQIEEVKRELEKIKVN